MGDKNDDFWTKGETNKQILKIKKKEIFQKKAIRMIILTKKNKRNQHHHLLPRLQCSSLPPFLMFIAPLNIVSLSYHHMVY
jgi:hypothetical protein